MSTFEKTIIAIAGTALAILLIAYFGPLVMCDKVTEIYPVVTNEADTTSVPDTMELSGITGTYYNPVPEQCDGTPLVTADGSKINLDKLQNWKIRWVALSRDLLKRWGGPLDHGDTIIVCHENPQINGKWVVHDVMNARAKQKIDFLVALGNKFPGKTRNIIIKKEV